MIRRSSPLGGSSSSSNSGLFALTKRGTYSSKFIIFLSIVAFFWLFITLYHFSTIALYAQQPNTSNNKRDSNVNTSSGASTTESTPPSLSRSTPAAAPVFNAQKLLSFTQFSNRKEENIRTAPGLTQDNALYLNDAYASLNRRTVYMNVILTYNRHDSGVRTFERIYEHHGYKIISGNTESQQQFLKTSYYPSYQQVGNYRCVFIDGATGKQVQTSVRAHPCPHPVEHATGFLTCDLPDPFAEELKQFNTFHMFLADIKTNTLLLQFQLTNPLKKLNIDPLLVENGAKIEGIVALSPIESWRLAYVIEWIEFHLIVGLKHFIIYTSERRQSELDRMEEFLQPYIRNHVVTFVKFSFPIEELQSSLQMPAYMDANFRAIDLAVWLFNMDSDEYMVPVNPERSLIPILNKYARDVRINELRVGHMEFEETGLIEEADPWKCDQHSQQLMIKKYRFRDQPNFYARTKYAGRIGAFEYATVHTLSSDDAGMRRVDPNSEFQMHHYWSSQSRRGVLYASASRDDYAYRTFGKELEERVKVARKNNPMWCFKGSNALTK